MLTSFDFGISMLPFLSGGFYSSDVLIMNVNLMMFFSESGFLDNTTSWSGKGVKLITWVDWIFAE